MTQNQKKWWILIGVGIASFLGCLDFTIVNTALPNIRQSLNIDIATLQWIVNIFVLALSSTMVIAGKLADIYGRKKLIYIGISLFTISSFFGGLAPNIEFLIFWRFVQGIACAIIYTSSGAIVSSAFELEERLKAMGIFYGIAFTGLAAGPAIGGILVGLFSWRAVFFLNVPLAIISLIICRFAISESKNEMAEKSIDYLGAIFLILAISSLVICLINGEAWGYTSNKTIATGFFSIIMFIILYKFETKIKYPILNFKLFANRAFFSGSVATFFLAVFYCLDLFLLPLFLSDIRHDNAITIGFMMLAITLFVAITPPLLGKVFERKSSYYPCILGFILFIISATCQINFSENSSLIFILVTFIITGIAWGGISSPSTVLSMEGLPKSSEALAMGTSWTIHNLGNMFGLSIGILIYHVSLNLDNHTFIDGFHTAIYLPLTTSIFAFLVLCFNYRKTKHHK